MVTGFVRASSTTGIRSCYIGVMFKVKLEPLLFRLELTQPYSYGVINNTMKETHCIVLYDA